MKQVCPVNRLKTLPALFYFSSASWPSCHLELWKCRKDLLPYLGEETLAALNFEAHEGFGIGKHSDSFWSFPWFLLKLHLVCESSLPPPCLTWCFGWTELLKCSCMLMPFLKKTSPSWVLQLINSLPLGWVLIDPLLSAYFSFTHSWSNDICVMEAECVSQKQSYWSRWQSGYGEISVYTRKPFASTGTGKRCLDCWWTRGRQR